jgi:peptidyl-prolyl cis-trans isomerase A (cyclophilin A)
VHRRRHLDPGGEAGEGDAFGLVVGHVPTSAGSAINLCSAATAFRCRHPFGTLIQRPHDDPTMTVAATLHTSEGDIEVELYDERAPRTVENFVNLAKPEPAADAEPAPDTLTWHDPETGEVRGDALYEDVAFHRVIEGFMIQGGDPTESGRGGPGYEFDDEFHDDLTHDGPGVLSMANSGPNTNGSQFFITLDAQPHLDGKHAVFGRVTDGMDVVEDIGSVDTDGSDQPVDEKVLESVTVHDE